MEDNCDWIYELAEVIAGWEKVIQNPKTSEKRKKEAEENLTKLTVCVMQLNNGIDILTEIDNIIQENNLI